MRFPDDSIRTPTTCRATYRLEPNRHRWMGHGFVATPDTWHEVPKMRLERPGDKLGGLV